MLFSVGTIFANYNGDQKFFLTNYEKVKNFILQKCLNHKTSYKILMIFLLVLDFPFATIDVEVLNENLSCNFCYNLILVTMIIIVTFYAFFHSQGTLNHHCGCQVTSLDYPHDYYGYS
jgi:hypothetical protein